MCVAGIPRVPQINGQIASYPFTRTHPVVLGALEGTVALPDRRRAVRGSGIQRSVSRLATRGQDPAMHRAPSPRLEFQRPARKCWGAWSEPNVPCARCAGPGSVPSSVPRAPNSCGRPDGVATNAISATALYHPGATRASCPDSAWVAGIDRGKRVQIAGSAAGAPAERPRERSTRSSTRGSARSSILIMRGERADRVRGRIHRVIACSCEVLIVWFRSLKGELSRVGMFAEQALGVIRQNRAK